MKINSSQYRNSLWGRHPEAMRKQAAASTGLLASVLPALNDENPEAQREDEDKAEDALTDNDETTPEPDRIQSTPMLGKESAERFSLLWEFTSRGFSPAAAEMLVARAMQKRADGEGKSIISRVLPMASDTTAEALKVLLLGGPLLVGGAAGLMLHNASKSDSDLDELLRQEKLDELDRTTEEIEEKNRLKRMARKGRMEQIG